MASSDNQSGASRPSGGSSTLQGATSTLSDIAGQAGDRVRDQASRAAGEVQEQAQAFFSEQKEVAADHLEGVAKVLHDTVDQLRQRSPGAVTDYAERAVDGLDSVATALREQDVRALVGRVEDFARRQPVLFLAGTVAIGFALARFLKSSGRVGSSYGQGPDRYDPSSQGYGSSGYRTGARGTEYSRHIDTGSTGQGGSSGTSGTSDEGRRSGQESG